MPAPGWFQTLTSDAPDGVQDAGTTMSGVGDTFVHLYDQLHEGVRQNQASVSLNTAGSLWHRDAVHRPRDEAIY